MCFFVCTPASRHFANKNGSMPIFSSVFANNLRLWIGFLSALECWQISIRSEFGLELVFGFLGGSVVWCNETKKYSKDNICFPSLCSNTEQKSWPCQYSRLPKSPSVSTTVSLFPLLSRWLHFRFSFSLIENTFLARERAQKKGLVAVTASLAFFRGSEDTHINRKKRKQHCEAPRCKILYKSREIGFFNFGTEQGQFDYRDTDGLCFKSRKLGKGGFDAKRSSGLTNLIVW